MRLNDNTLKTFSLMIGLLLGGVAALTALLLALELKAALPLAYFSETTDHGLVTAAMPWLQAQARSMGFPLQGETPAFWYMARVSGIMAYFFMWGSAVWGLLLSTKIAKGWLAPLFTFGMHEFLSLLGLGFALFHSLILLGDTYIQFDLSQILLPFSASYEAFWVGLGTIGLYLYALISVSFYFKKRLGHKLWRGLHYLTFGLYLLITAHSIAIGSDTTLIFPNLLYLGPALLLLFLTFYRILAHR